MGRKCNTNTAMMDTKFLSEDQKGTRHLHELGTDGRVSFRRILKKQNKRAQDRVQWLGLVNTIELRELFSAMWYCVTW